MTSLALSHDGNCLLAACLDSRMRLLDRGSGTLLAQYTGAHYCETLCPSPAWLDACLDSRLRLLDRASGTLLAQYTGAHHCETLCPSTAWLAASLDSRLRLHDRASGTLLGQHTSARHTVSVFPRCVLLAAWLDSRLRLLNRGSSTRLTPHPWCALHTVNLCPNRFVLVASIPHGHACCATAAARCVRITLLRMIANVMMS